MERELKDIATDKGEEKKNDVGEERKNDVEEKGVFRFNPGELESLMAIAEIFSSFQKNYPSA